MIDSTALTQCLMEENEMSTDSIGTSPSWVSHNSASSAAPDTIVEMGGTQAIAEALNNNVTTQHAHELHPDTVITVSENVVQELDHVMIEMPSDEHSRSLCQVIQYVLQGDFEAASAAAKPGSLAALLIKAGMATNSPASAVEAMIQRTHMIVDLCGELLTKLGRNEFEGDLGRWTSNLTISGVRTGLVTAILTTCRQLIGFALEKNLLANAAAPLTHNVMNGIALAVGPALNILGAARDELNHTANQETRLARIGTGILSIAAVVLVMTAPQAVPAFTAFGAQTAFYSFATDLVNLFLPTTDKVKANLGGTDASGVLNGVLQFLAFTGMNYTAPHSGPGYVMSQGKEPPPTEPQTFCSQLSVWVAQNIDTAHLSTLSVESRNNDTRNLALKLEHDVRRGFFNAGADVASQVLGGKLMHYLQGESDKPFRITMSAQIPTVEQVLNQFLSTNAVRTSVSETIIAVVISATRFFSALPIPKANVDHIVNTLVAAVVFAGRFGAVYVNERTPAKQIPIEV